MWKPFGFALCILSLSRLSAAGSQENPADEITSLINANRASTKLAKLHNNAGLGCMALQFLSQCAGNCSSNGTLSCQPPAADITEVYAPNCGVELPTVGVISGYLRGCHWSRLSADQAFSDVLRRDEKAASLVHGKDLTELGAGFMREKHGAFYWCILFSNETSNSSFVLEQGGRGIEQKFGCFSGSDVPCSAAKKLVVLGSLMKGILMLQPWIHYHAELPAFYWELLHPIQKLLFVPREVSIQRAPPGEEFVQDYSEAPHVALRCEMARLDVVRRRIAMSTCHLIPAETELVT